MATAQQRILRHLSMGKQLTTAQLSKATMHGESTVKGVLNELRKRRLVLIVGTKRGATNSARIWRINPNPPQPAPKKPTARERLTNSVLEALAGNRMTTAEIAAAIGKSFKTVRRAVGDLYGLDKIKVAEFRVHRGQPVRVFSLPDGQPDAVYVRHVAKVVRIDALTPPPITRTHIQPRRDIAASWF